MNKALILFIVCTFANVIISTIKSVMTIKGGKISAAVWNALGYGLYSFIVVMTATAEITTLEKVLVTVGCNLIGVYGVKLVEEKMRKDRLWKFEITIPAANRDAMCAELTTANIPFNYIDKIGKWTIFNVFAANQAESKIVKAISDRYNGKTFATETKLAP